MKSFLLVVLVLATGISSAQTKMKQVVLSPAAYKEAIQESEVQLIDVRTPEEYKAGHLPNARNIDFLKSDFLDKMDALDRNTPLFIYCRSGNRSSKAAKKLHEMGFKKIIDLKGGYQAWMETYPSKDIKS